MPDPTPADELRAASARLRYLLHPDGMPEPIRANWTQLPYPEKQGVITVPGEERPVLMAFWGGVSEYLTAVQPGVGALLADWLEHAAVKQDAAGRAADITWGDSSDVRARNEFVAEMTDRYALATARAINATAGGQP